MLKIKKDKTIQINTRRYEDEIVISPNQDEHWFSVDFFNFRIWAERHQKHVVGITSLNYVPQFSQFCDEIVIVPANCKWYSGSYTWNGIASDASRLKHRIVNIERMAHVFREEVTDQQVVERFANRKIYILRSAYKIFESLDLPSDLIVIEAKNKHNIFHSILNMKQPNVVGLGDGFQSSILEKTTTSHYLSTQILASNLLNWQFVCIHGSSNLMCTLPVKTLVLYDQTIKQHTINIVRGLNINKTIPFMSSVDNKSLFCVPNFERFLTYDNLMAAFEILTKEWNPPEIVYIDA